MPLSFIPSFLSEILLRSPNTFSPVAWVPVMGSVILFVSLRPFVSSVPNVKCLICWPILLQGVFLTLISHQGLWQLPWLIPCSCTHSFIHSSTFDPRDQCSHSQNISSSYFVSLSSVCKIHYRSILFHQESARRYFAVQDSLIKCEMTDGWKNKRPKYYLILRLC